MKMVARINLVYFYVVSILNQSIIQILVDLYHKYLISFNVSISLQIYQVKVEILVILNTSQDM